MAITERYVSSGGTGSYSDSLSSSTPSNLATAFSNAAAGDRFNLQEGTYTQSANLSFTVNGTATSPIVFRGVTTAWAAITTARTGTTGPIDTAHHPAIAFGSTYRWDITGNYVVLENLNITGTYNGGLVNHGPSSGTGTYGVHRGVVVNNAGTGTGVYALRFSSQFVSFCSDYTLSGSPTTGRVLDGYSNSATPRLFGCRLKATGANAYGCYAFGGTFYKTLIHSTGNAAIYNAATTSNATLIVAGCTLVDSAAQGISVVTGNIYSQIVVDTRITDCGTYGIYSPDASCLLIAAYNRLDRNTTADYSGGADWRTATNWGNILTDQAKSAEYTNAAAFDYTLMATAEGIADGVYPSTDMGAMQTPGTGVTIEGGGGGGGGSSGYSGFTAKGTTSAIIHVMVYDAATGVPATGIPYTGFACTYMRSGASSATNATVDTITTLGTFAGSATNAAIKEVNASTMAGLYELHLPNNALSTGSDRVTIMLREAASSGISPVRIELSLTAMDPQDGVHLGITALPNAAAGTTSGLPISSDIADDATMAAAILDLVDGIEPGLTPRSAMRLISAVCAGTLSGAGTSTHAFKGVLNTGKTRVTMGTDIPGNRTPATYDLT